MAKEAGGAGLVIAVLGEPLDEDVLSDSYLIVDPKIRNRETTRNTNQLTNRAWQCYLKGKQQQGHWIKTFLTTLIRHRITAIPIFPAIYGTECATASPL